MTEPEQPTIPGISSDLTEFFACERHNEDSMRREAQNTAATYDENDSDYIPPTSLGTCLDSCKQAPDDVRETFLTLPATMPAIEKAASVTQAEVDLNTLISTLGPAFEVDHWI